MASTTKKVKVTVDAMVKYTYHKGERAQRDVGGDEPAYVEVDDIAGLPDGAEIFDGEMERLADEIQAELEARNAE